MVNSLPTSVTNILLFLHVQTSIVFSLEEGPGVLFKALAVFALRDINLTKVCYLVSTNVVLPQVFSFTCWHA